MNGSRRSGRPPAGRPTRHAPELLTEAAQKTQQVREETRAETLAAAEAESEQALEAELARLQQASDEHLTRELGRVRSESEQALEAQLIAASTEAERVRTEATRDAREAAESAAEQALRSEIARVRADTQKTLAIELVKLRSEDDERRKRELADITAQVAQLKDAAAEQAKAAAAAALQSELDRVRQTAVVQERVIRLAPPPMEPSVAPAVAETHDPIVDDSPAPDTTGDSPETSHKDYYSLWHSAEGENESDAPSAVASRTSRVRQIVLGGAVAACLLVGVMLGTGGVEGPETGSILIDGPPGAQVWVEGTLIGETPLPEISAELGEREVVVIHPENGEVRQMVTVGTDAPQS